MIRFIDREEELATLESEWKLTENAFIVVYGRRRIGKTKLLEEFTKNKNGIKYTAEDTNKKIQLRELKTIIAEHLNDAFLAQEDISDWSSLFTYLAKTMDKTKKIYLWIDEFSYLIKNDPTITSTLQKFIDQFLRQSKIFLIASGSLFGLMSEKILAYTSPLYGRRTKDILVKQIPAQHLPEFLNMPFEDTLKTILTIGGIPEYLQTASKYQRYEEFISKEFLKKDGHFYREPQYLLSQEFKEIKTYFSILNAIAYGNTKPTEIANFTGLNTREIYPYLELLINYGFIKREIPLIGDKKKGIYKINDAFFDAWFNITYENREDIEKNTQKINTPQLNQFLGKRFEMLINETAHLFLKNYTKYGRWWHKGKEIDIVALNENTKEILFAECKWQEKVNPEQIIKELLEKTQYVEWNNETGSLKNNTQESNFSMRTLNPEQKPKVIKSPQTRKETFAIFAKTFTKKITEYQGKKVQCFDLNDIEQALK